MKEQKLRKFKLIDREGFSQFNAYNRDLLAQEYFTDDTVEGYMTTSGFLRIGTYTLITPREFKFFAEIKEEIKEDSNMNNEKKLQKFKIIDREGFINADSDNEQNLKGYFVEDTITGYVDAHGTLLIGGEEVIFSDEFKFFEEVFDTVTDSDNQKGETVMEEQELRKFKLIDREGYINAWYYNETKLKDFFVGNTVEGRIDENGRLLVGGYFVIFSEEFKFFEEVFDTPAPALSKFKRFNKEWVVVAPHPVKKDYTIIAAVDGGFASSLQNEELEELLKPKTWQAVVEDELGFEHSAEDGTFTLPKRTLSEKEFFSTAERILELANREKTDI